MQIIKYQLFSMLNYGTEEEPSYKPLFYATKTMPWSEANEAIAKQEAYNGEYTVEDDGKPEPEPQTTPEERIAELEQALELLLSGVTE